MNIKRRDFIKFGAITTIGMSGSSFVAPLASDRDRIAVLYQNFLSPPTEVKPGCYWWWFNGLVNKEGITRDMEEFRDKGLGEVLMVHTSGGLGGAEVPKGFKAFSPEWNEMVRHAFAEANRLDIKIGVNMSGGWCMGGPWIAPEESGRWFLQSELNVIGPKKFDDVLPLPGNRSGYDYVFNPPGYKEYIDLPLSKLDYRDTAIVAFPVGDASMIKLSDSRPGEFSAKTNRKDASNTIREDILMVPILKKWKPEPYDKPISPEKVIDLTQFVDSDGRLKWNIPPGRWRIIRTGHRMTGSKLMIAPEEINGLSVDWLKSSPVDIQFKNFGQKIIDIAGQYAKKTLKYFCDDSFEDGFPNWTDQILERFEYYRGYNPRPYLPVLAGYTIGDAIVSDRFLNDYRKTVADCLADGHYKRFAELCHEKGLLVQNEAAGPSRSGTMCMDGMKNLGRSDLPQGEFWLGVNHDEEGGLDDSLSYGQSRLEFGQNKVTKMISSAAHIYGKKTAAAEAYTTYRHWKDAPASMKQATDRAFCEGINRILIHSTTATRPQDGKPGYEYGAGTHFNPNVTWWNKSGAFLTYLARCQYLLQQGNFVADVLYYNGDWAPNIVAAKHVNLSLGKGFDYDACNEEILLQKLSVKNNQLILPGGMSYRLMVLPETDRMPLPVLKKIRQLVNEGATIAGPRPSIDSGLKNHPACDKEIEKIAAEVWGKCDGKTITENNFGKGKIYWGKPLIEILIAANVKPDLLYAGNSATTFIDYIHRKENDDDIYFIANRNKRQEIVTCTFRANGTPEIWDPVTGEKFRPENCKITNEQTSVNIDFDAFQSWFVIFSKTSNTKKLKQLYKPAALIKKMKIEGPWLVSFNEKWGGPRQVQFNALEDWTTRHEQGIKYYSGTAVYKKQFDLDFPKDSRSEFFIDLGLVKEIASVKLNGKNLGIVWTAPWRIECSRFLKEKQNELEIEVDNLWVNRLLLDAKLPPAERLTRTNISIPKDYTLMPSGLLGPVKILQVIS